MTDGIAIAVAWGEYVALLGVLVYLLGRRRS
jgi:hypothetical protein